MLHQTGSTFTKSSGPADMDWSPLQMAGLKRAASHGDEHHVDEDVQTFKRRRLQLAGMKWDLSHSDEDHGDEDHGDFQSSDANSSYSQTLAQESSNSDVPPNPDILELLDLRDFKFAATRKEQAAKEIHQYQEEKRLQEWLMRNKRQKNTDPWYHCPQFKQQWQREAKCTNKRYPIKWTCLD